MNMPEDDALRFRFGYELLPTLFGSAPANRSLNLLLARTSLSGDDARRLAVIQYAKWYCDDMSTYIVLEINLVVPENAAALRSVFDRLGVDYETGPSLDETDAQTIAALARTLDCGFVLAHPAIDLATAFTDEYGLVGTEVLEALHSVEIHMKGFDLPWSFEVPAKNMPWSNFYTMSEQDTFQPLLKQHAASAQAGAEIHEIMRSLVADAFVSLCFSRDRLEFYRQQDRWAQRAGLERQDFGVEYAAFLNYFYLTYYAAVDQTAKLVIKLYDMKVPEDQIGATYKAFREARKAFREIDRAFSDSAFWKMYRIPRLIRHHAAHNGPVKPQAIYTGSDDPTIEQLDETAEKQGFFDNLHYFEQRGMSQEMLDYLREVGRFKAKLELWGPPIRHGVPLREGKDLFFYYPGPAQDLERLFAFFDRVLGIILPWDKLRTPDSGDAP